ncbi:prepilin peptidase [Rubellicoccus peritrichatus]|uniref:Prepilin peptidase n=1 Tax=Rubellicoccus peritrichatus TaxID=3080537 RepID=A0AAQ3QVL7_9BACT|nr:prepilin peptidase [Puniceicoccus sp. CR14]WOO40937.1 prepilin peptidase [Puniceicoccus sp. CR14]
MLQNLEAVNNEFPWFFATVVFIFGCCWGSFLNVVIYRVPKKLSVVTPRSFCTTSKKPIPWYDNIPILSWIILGGKSRFDRQPISIRYPAVELLTGILFLCAWLLLPPVVALVGFPFIAILIAGTWIDLDHMILPDFSTIGGMLLGVLLSFLFPALHDYATGEPFLVEGIRSMIVAVIGIFVGSGVILWIAILAESILKKEAMGFGDVLFMGCIGAFCGWQGALFAVFGGALIGTIVVIPLMIMEKLFGIKIPALGNVENSQSEESAGKDTSKETKEPTSEDKADDSKEDTDLKMGTAIPFGPWLALGAVIYYIFLRGPVDNYFYTLQELLFGQTW